MMMPEDLCSCIFCNQTVVTNYRRESAREMGEIWGYKKGGRMDNNADSSIYHAGFEKCTHNQQADVVNFMHNVD